MPVIETEGSASSQGFGQFSRTSEAVYIESCFSTWLYTGNGGTQTITNGIDLAGKGGLVWIKNRGIATNHLLFWQPTSSPWLSSNTTSMAGTLGEGNEFTSSGFGLKAASPFSNAPGNTYASWTFRKQPKFFDIVTYTGTGANRTIAHALGSVPGCIIVKRTDTTGDWQVYHRSLANTQYMVLNSTAAVATGATRWNSTTPTATEFSLGTDATVNANGGTYVAYLFAHDAGGFGATGADNVISCGSFTTDGSGNATVNLGYEPQWVLTKRTNATSPWILLDNMRGWTAPAGSVNLLRANLADAESTGNPGGLYPNATGFSVDSSWGGSATTFIYIAIRRGPMRTPTSGTSVFRPDSIDGTFWTVISPNGRLGSSVNGLDAVFTKSSGAADNWTLTPRLTGFSSTTSVSPSLSTNTTDAESVKTGGVRGGSAASSTDLQAKAIATGSAISYSLGRAPGFFDVVCYTGTGVTRTINHNLTVTPELWLIKRRSGIAGFIVGGGALGSATDDYLSLGDTAAKASFLNLWTTPTAATFGIGTATPTSGTINSSGQTYVAYLFASCPGVSKVGSYTGTGITLTINCGFAAGARFVLIKRTNGTGDWYVWDSARGIVAGNDPYLLLNTANAEVTNTDWVDTAASGFELSNAAGNDVNINGASYIFLSVS
jgi:hypothetical protein